MTNYKNMLQVCLFSFFQLIDKSDCAIEIGLVRIVITVVREEIRLCILLPYPPDVCETLERRIYSSLEQFKEDIPKLVTKCEEIITLSQQ